MFGGLWPGAHQVHVSVFQSPSKLLLRLIPQPQPHGWPKMLKSGNVDDDSFTFTAPELILELRHLR